MKERKDIKRVEEIVDDKDRGEMMIEMMEGSDMNEREIDGRGGIKKKKDRRKIEKLVDGEVLVVEEKGSKR